MASWRRSSLLLLSTLILFQDAWTGECDNIKHWQYLQSMVSEAAATREASCMQQLHEKLLMLCLYILWTAFTTIEHSSKMNCAHHMVEWRTSSRQGASHAQPGDIIVSFVPLFLSKPVTTNLSPHPGPGPHGPRSTVHVHLLVHAIPSLFTFWLFVHHTITMLANLRVLYSGTLDFVIYSASDVLFEKTFMDRNQ
jgi:hypothetical protein